MKKGKAAQLYLAEVRKTIAAVQDDPVLKPYADKLDAALGKVEKVTGHLLGIAMKGDPERVRADATLYLDLFGIVAIAGQRLLQAQAARKGLAGNPIESDVHFYQGKMHACRYFYGYELPKIEGLLDILMNADGLTVEMSPAYFEE